MLDPLALWRTVKLLWGDGRVLFPWNSPGVVSYLRARKHRWDTRFGALLGLCPEILMIPRLGFNEDSLPFPSFRRGVVKSIVSPSLRSMLLISWEVFIIYPHIPNRYWMVLPPAPACAHRCRLTQMKAPLVMAQKGYRVHNVTRQYHGLVIIG